MAIPKIKHPLFTLIQPSTGKKLTFRPFTVKEEKILLVAQADTTGETVVDHVRQVIQNCITTPGFNAEKIPSFDLEYIFLKLRCKSVSNILPLEIPDPDDPKTIHKVDVDLETVEVYKDPEHSNKIQVDDAIGFFMKYPDADTIRLVQEAMGKKNDNDDGAIRATFSIIANCIDKIFEGDDVHVAGNDFSSEEASEFVDSLPTDAFVKVQKFFDTLPELRHTVHYKTAKGEDKTIVLKGLLDFFS